MFLHDALLSLIPSIPEAREKVLDGYAKRAADAALGFDAARRMVGVALELITRIPLKTVRPRLTEDAYAGVGRLVETAKALQKLCDANNGESEVASAIRAAVASRKDEEFDANARAAELTITRHEGAANEARMLVGRLALQLDALNAAGDSIFSSEFTVSKPVAAATVSGVI